MENTQTLDEKNTLQHPECSFVGIDGNAFSLMGHWNRCARKAGWDNPSIDEVINEATSGDYHHLIRTLMKYSK